MDILSSSVEETRAVGALAAQRSQPGDVWALTGDLGCGKTEFVRGFTAALLPGSLVRSPTFTILNIYDTPRFPVYHFDFYRVKSPQELFEIGFGEYVLGSGVCLIEWADMFPNSLPAYARTLSFIDIGNNNRKITIPDA
jgi:tRNA threonylcarbamoyladenosine biosynthesis protein TsaE